MELPSYNYYIKHKSWLRLWFFTIIVHLPAKELLLWVWLLLVESASCKTTQRKCRLWAFERKMWKTPLCAYLACFKGPQITIPCRSLKVAVLCVFRCDRTCFHRWKKCQKYRCWPVGDDKPGDRRVRGESRFYSFIEGFHAFIRAHKDVDLWDWRRERVRSEGI